MDNARRVLPRARAEEIRDLLLDIDSCRDVRALAARLGAA
jgi:hypothetical protein